MCGDEEDEAHSWKEDEAQSWWSWEVVVCVRACGGVRCAVLWCSGVALRGVDWWNGVAVGRTEEEVEEGTCGEAWRGVECGGES